MDMSVSILPRTNKTKITILIKVNYLFPQFHSLHHNPRSQFFITTTFLQDSIINLWLDHHGEQEQKGET